MRARIPSDWGLQVDDRLHFFDPPVQAGPLQPSPLVVRQAVHLDIMPADHDAFSLDRAKKGLRVELLSEVMAFQREVVRGPPGK